MRRHLFIVEANKDVNLLEIKKLYDTVSIIEFSDNTTEVVAENIGDSVFKSVLYIPSRVLYGGDIPIREFQELYKKNEIKRIIKTINPEDIDSIRIIYKDFDDFLGVWSDIKEQNISEILNPS